MKVYILDRRGKSREQMLEWLSEDKRLTGIEVFEDYINRIIFISDDRDYALDAYEVGAYGYMRVL